MYSSMKWTNSKMLGTVPMLVLGAALAATTAGLVLDRAAQGPSVDRVLLSGSSEDLVLHFEAFAYEVRPPKVLELLVFADGRVHGQVAPRGTVEWRISTKELVSLVTAVADTGVFDLTTQDIATAHSRYVDEKYDGGGPSVSEVEVDRLVVNLPGYRESSASHFSPVSMDISYQSAPSLAERMPEVGELVTFSEAIRVVRSFLVTASLNPTGATRSRSQSITTTARRRRSSSTRVSRGTLVSNSCLPTASRPETHRSGTL